MTLARADSPRVYVPEPLSHELIRGAVEQLRLFLLIVAVVIAKDVEVRHDRSPATFNFSPCRANTAGGLHAVPEPVVTARHPFSYRPRLDSFTPRREDRTRRRAVRPYLWSHTGRLRHSASVAECVRGILSELFAILGGEAPLWLMPHRCATAETVVCARSVSRRSVWTCRSRAS